MLQRGLFLRSIIFLKINIKYLITIWQKMEPKPSVISNLPTKSIALMEDFVYDKSGIKKRAQVGDLQC